MENLLQETINVILDKGYSEEDVSFCQITRRCYRRDGRSFVRDFQFSFEVFKKNADFMYHNGYGGEEVETSLKVVFNDGGWLERMVYDGSEWWRYNKCPSFKTFDDIEIVDFQYHYENNEYHDDISKILKVFA